MQNFQDVQLAAAAFREWLAPLAPQKFQLGLILGTGLSGLAREMEIQATLPFAAIPNFPQSGVESHQSMFAAGRLGDAAVIAQLGRCHLYEGRSPAEICMGVRLMAAAGVKALIVTNAAGALNPVFSAGGLMLMSDFINHTGVSPLTGPNAEAWGERFPDMSAPFDRELQRIALTCALRNGIRLERGVYIGVHGPEMETPAETRMYRQWGADAVGMSTVLEVIAARHCGLKVMGISCLTNKNLPDCMEPAPLAKVLEVAAGAGKDLGRLILALCREGDFAKAIA